MISAEFMLSDDGVCGLEDAIRSAATKSVTNDHQIGIEKYFNHIVVTSVLVVKS